VTRLDADDLLAWNALRSTPGLGPKRLARLTLVLAERGRPAASLVGAPPAELVALGLSPQLAEAAFGALSSPVEVDVPDWIHAFCPSDQQYPSERMSEALPLPVVLWVVGQVSLLRSPGIAIAGARSAPVDVLDLAGELAAVVAKAGVNVVSGNAAGVDSAAHAGALRVGGTTTAVLAEGLEQGLRDRTQPNDSVLIVSGFEPRASWTASRAMERNTHIAALSDAVVIVAAGLRGGSWAQGQLCLRAGKRLFVLDLPAEVAPGNPVLIRKGALAVLPDRLDHVLDRLGDQVTESEQLRLPG